MSNSPSNTASKTDTTHPLIALEEFPNPFSIVGEIGKAIITAFFTVLIAIGTGVFNLFTAKKVVDALPPEVLPQILDSANRINKYSELIKEAESRGDIAGAKVLRKALSEEYTSVADILEKALPSISLQDTKVAEQVEKIIKQARALSSSVSQPYAPLPTFKPQDINQSQNHLQDDSSVLLAHDSAKADRTIDNASREEILVALNASGSIQKLGLDSNNILDQDVALQLFAKSKNSSRDFTLESPNLNNSSSEESEKYKNLIDGKAQDILDRQSPAATKTTESSYAI